MASTIEQQFSNNVVFYDFCSRVGSTLFVGPSNGAKTNVLLLLPFRWHLQSNNSFRIMFSFMISALALGRLCLSVRQMEQRLMFCCSCHSMASAIEQQFSNVFFYDSCSRVGSTLFVGPSNGARTNALLLLPFRWHLQSNNSFRMFSFMIPALALGRLCLSVRQMEQGLMLCCCCHFDGICNRTTVFECFLL